MKIKYKRLNKDERKEIKEKYYKIEKGLYVKKKLLMAIICGAILIIFSGYLFIDNFINRKITWEYVYDISIFIAGIILIVMASHIKIKKLNDFITKKTSK